MCDGLNLTEIILAVIGDSDVSGSSWYHGHFVVSKRSAWPTETLRQRLGFNLSRLQDESVSQTWDKRHTDSCFTTNKSPVIRI